MTQDTEQLVASLEPLTHHAFEAFCEDIASMFGNSADCEVDSAGRGKLSELKTVFKKLAAVNRVESVGPMNGSFQLMLDQAGLFILAGVFVMLPEKRIFETVRNGTLKDAGYINDAIKEVGNLLVGSWDRIAREELAEHKHFKQTGTFVGSVWDNPETNIGFSADEECRYVICRMKVDDFPEFKCTAVFSERLFQPQTVPAEPQADAAAPTDDTATTAESAESSEPQEQAAAVKTPADTPDTDSSEASLPEPASDRSTEQRPGPVAEAIRALTQHTKPFGSLDASGSAALSGLTAEQVMSPAMLWVQPEDTVEEVLRQMQHHNVGYVLAGQDGRIEGLLSRSDLAAATSPYLRPVFAHWRRPQDDASLQIRVKWFMSRPVHTVDRQARLETVLHTMMRHGVRGLPVVAEDGLAIGLITVYDIFAALLGCAGVQIAGSPQQAPAAVK